MAGLFIIINLLICLRSYMTNDGYKDFIRFTIVAPTRRLKGKALIKENGYSLVKINTDACKPFKFNLWLFISKLIYAQN